jgi:hypothetical protein
LLNRPKGLIATKWLWFGCVLLNVFKLFNPIYSVGYAVLGVVGFGALALATTFQYERVIEARAEQDPDLKHEIGLRLTGYTAIGIQIAAPLIGDAIGL